MISANRSYCQFTSFLEREEGASHQASVKGQKCWVLHFMDGETESRKAPSQTELECESPDSGSGALSFPRRPVAALLLGLFSHDKPCSLF